MPRMFHRPVRADGQKVFLATPCVKDVDAGYTFALFTSSAALSEAGIAAELALYSGDCHVDDARNSLVRQFLDTDCTDLFFIDADIRWEPKDLVNLLEHDRDVVAATYPFKDDNDGFPVAFRSGEIWSDLEGLIDVQAVPTGFLRIKRHVLETLADKAVKVHPKSGDSKQLPIIFERTVHNGHRRGGDYTFCRKWLDAGGKIYLDPEIELDHTGDKTWSGSLGHFQRVQIMGGVSAGIHAIRHGRETNKTYQDMLNAWNNAWSGDSNLLETSVQLVRNLRGQVLELGSGITTLAMAAANPDVVIHAVEHDEKWLARISQELLKNKLHNVVLHYAPLVNGWYDPAKLPRGPFVLVLNDGPPRNLGERSGLFDNVDMTGAILLADDMNEPSYRTSLEQWATDSGREVHLLGHKLRKIAVVPCQ